MEKKDLILVLKLIEGDNLPIDKLVKLADGDWKINAIRLQSVKYVILLIHKKVIYDFSLGDNVNLELSTGRVSKLGLKNADNITGLVGKKLDYNTANPATIKDLGSLHNLIIK